MEQMEIDENPENVNEKHNLSKKYFAIEYPGIVENVDRMLETLGGIDTLSDVFENNRRMEVRFRPSDKYSKPAWADQSQTTGLILKIKYKKNKSQHNDCNTSMTITSANIIGVVDKIYKFSYLCDYQYLPIHRNDDGTLENIYDRLIPDILPSYSWIEENNVPHFLPPPNFSRMDTIDGYMFRKISKNDPHKVQHLIGKTRKRRPCHAKNIYFSSPSVPTGPLKTINKLLRTKFITDEMLNTIKRLFDERPIWSRNALVCRSGLPLEKLKYVLTASAYYFLTGPWRVMWVRFGYDPRKDPSARKYQTFDFRPKIREEYKHLIQVKRSVNVTFKVGSWNSAQRRHIYVGSKQKPGEKVVTKATLQENEYKFVPGMLPPARQMFYQYCDLEVPEIQAMLARLPEPGPDAVCSEKTGWMPSGIDERCREILKEIIELELKARTWKSKEPKEEGDEDWEDFEISGDEDVYEES